MERRRYAAAAPRHGPPAAPAGEVPVAAGDARRPGAGVHDADGGALGRAVRPDRLLVDRRRGPGPTPGDQTALDVAEDLSDGALDATWRRSSPFFGSLFVVGPVAIAAGAWLASRRRWTELAVLVSGMAVILVMRAEIKDVDRSPAAPGRPGRRQRLVLPEQARRLRHDLHLARGHGRFPHSTRGSPGAAC